MQGFPRHIVPSDAKSAKSWRLSALFEQGLTGAEGNDNQTDDSENFPRSTEIQKGKYSEGDAAAYHGAGAERPATEGAPLLVSLRRNRTIKKNERRNLAELSLTPEPSSECRSI